MKQIDKALVVMVIISFLILGVSFAAAKIDNINIAKEKGSNPNFQEEDLEVGAVESFTGLLVGLDKSKGLTDVLMVGVLDAEKNTIHVISVPRDLEIDFSDENFRHIKENNPNNNIMFCKLNEVYSNVGHDERAFEDLREIISIIVGRKIDYMARIDVDGFSQLVDTIGGVEFDVPERMYYSDPFQDLYIDLQPGLQMLDGDKAEQLVRYRHYKMGDLQRIQVQQEFMVALFEKVMEIKDFSKIKELATKGYSMFEADFGLIFALKYAGYFFEQDLGNILNTANMVTIPSYGEKIGDLWYQRWYLDEANQVVVDLIEGSQEPVGKILRQ